MNRIRPQKFVHVVYRTRQFEKMLAWYSTVFDAKVQHQDPALAFLTHDDEHHRFAFVNLGVFDPEEKLTSKRGAVGVDHVAYAFGSLRELLENYAQLRELGISIALDDFGTGYSALGYLRKFPLDKIKIDRSFITDMATRSDQVAIIQAVLSIARALGMTVTAEGVETVVQRDFLKALGCDSAQGFLYGKPAPFERAVEILGAREKRKFIAA